MFDVVVIGAGLAGSVQAILLSRSGLRVCLIEKNKLPFHRVCGEYVSNEVRPFLERHGLFPHSLNPSTISRLEISSNEGKSFSETLASGGFGLSRYAFDFWLVTKARESGVTVVEGEQVVDVIFRDPDFEVATQSGTSLCARYVIGAHGKRSKLDQSLGRPFLSVHSPYVGVKYHIKTDQDPTTIYLHNFSGGYCGINRIEGDLSTLCYLIHRGLIRKWGSIAEVEKHVLRRNPLLRHLLENSEIIFDTPLVINEVSFKAKEPVYGHVLLTGDASGTIAPLCGNGMANAIRSAAILSELVTKFFEDRSILENEYRKIWRETFSARLAAGRQIQHLFGSGFGSGVAVFLGQNFPGITRKLIALTHGKPF